MRATRHSKATTLSKGKVYFGGDCDLINVHVGKRDKQPLELEGLSRRVTGVEQIVTPLLRAVLFIYFAFDAHCALVTDGDAEADEEGKIDSTNEFTLVS